MLELEARDDKHDYPAPRASSLLEGARAQSEVDRVYAAIFDAMMDRRLLPGAKLTESTLCDIFSCSRATVRSALSQLAYDKLVIHEPNRGAFVWQPSPKETQDVFDARMALECLLIDRLLTLPDLPSRLQTLRTMVEHERKAFEGGDRIAWLRLSNAFHVKLADQLGNDVLTGFMYGLCARTTLIIAHHDTPETSTCSYLEHEIILDKLEANDGEGARKAMHDHLQDCVQRLHERDRTPSDPWMAFSVKR